VKEDESRGVEDRGVEDAGERAESSEAERQERLSPDKAALLDEEFTAIVAEHRELVLSLLGKHRVKSQDMEDLSQEVFLALRNQMLGGKLADNIPAMLNVIVTRRAIDYTRAELRAPVSHELPTSSTEVPGSQLDVERALHFQKVARHIFSQLSPEHREVIDAIFRRRLTYADAAAALGIPHGTFNSRALAAKRAFIALAEPFLPPSQRGSL
jgi:RNA polymerase sigma-70 factor (ECF subfamily)